MSASTEQLKERIRALAALYWPEVVQLRRHIHQYPELSFQEEATSRLVVETLRGYGIEVTIGVAGTGVVAHIYGEDPHSKTIALRADMDALPIQEDNDVVYKSSYPGVMHACGHDVHTASLLGVARILQETRHLWKGTIKCLFQPGEEVLPGGASLMIQEGALEHPAPVCIFGQHVAPDLEVGKVGFRPGIYMASSDELYLTIRGKGGHGAMPHLTVDPIVVAAHIITALQQITSRAAHPAMPTVLTLGKINSVGGATNVIPDEVRIEGTFRTFDEQWRASAKEQMQRMAVGIAEGMGASCAFKIVKGYPVLKNEESLTLRAKVAAMELLGADQVVDLPIRMTSEDFAWYTQELPGCFYRLGTRNERLNCTSGVHTSTFDIDEQALELGIALMSWLAISELLVGK